MSGEARPGRLLAIMGPSGSGKTTLLNVLAGQLTASPRLHLSGVLEFNGKPASKNAYKYARLVYECICCTFNVFSCMLRRIIKMPFNIGVGLLM